MLRPSLAKFYEYQTIPFRLYLEIANSNDYQKLVISGKAKDDKCDEVWEAIIAENSKHTRTKTYDRYLDKFKNISSLKARFVTERAILEKLSLGVDFRNIKDKNDLFIGADLDLIKEMRERGYIISTVSEDQYRYTLLNAWAKHKNILTKIEMAEKALIRWAQENEGKAATYEDIVSQLRFDLKPIVISNEITLAEYNALNNIRHEIHLKQQKQ
jgi:hypothetical protein